MHFAIRRVSLRTVTAGNFKPQGPYPRRGALTGPSLSISVVFDPSSSSPTPTTSPSCCSLATPPARRSSHQAPRRRNSRLRSAAPAPLICDFRGKHAGDHKIAETPNTRNVSWRNLVASCRRCRSPSNMLCQQGCTAGASMEVHECQDLSSRGGDT